MLPTHHIPLVRQVIPPVGARLEVRIARHLGEEKESLTARHVWSGYLILLPIEFGALSTLGHVPRSREGIERRRAGRMDR